MRWSGSHHHAFPSSLVGAYFRRPIRILPCQFRPLENEALQALSLLLLRDRMFDLFGELLPPPHVLTANINPMWSDDAVVAPPTLYF